MTTLRANLFGRFQVACHDHDVQGLDARRVQELLAYLLLNRGHWHPREHLADVLWGDAPAEQVRKGLRQTLWKLRSCLEPMAQPILHVDSDFVTLDEQAPLWLDVAAFEDAYRAGRGRPGSALDTETAEGMQAAVELYRGHLLEGWYNDWCLEKRERFLSMYLSMLNSLTAYCAFHSLYDAGLDYGHRALHHDHAHERTHRHLMRLYALSGDRSGALRQYQRCVDALRDELGVEPAGRTTELFQRIRADVHPEPAMGTPVASMFGANGVDRGGPNSTGAIPRADQGSVSRSSTAIPQGDQPAVSALLSQIAELRASVAAVEGQVARFMGGQMTDRAEPGGRSK